MPHRAKTNLATGARATRAAKFACDAKFPKKALASGTFLAAAHLMPLSGYWQAGADPGTAKEQAS
jgi:hypothetical protein